MPISLLRSGTLTIDVDLAATGIARAITIDNPPVPLWVGDVFVAGATITGPITQVTFYFRTAAGTNVSPPQTVAVVAGRAQAAFTAPAPTTGLRLRAADTSDPTLFVISRTFAVTLPPRLMLETGGVLLLEGGSALLA